jgi:hypothetical protein
VTNRSLQHPAPPTTRFERGIALAQERFEEITRVAPWIWSVPSCSGAGVHAVNLKHGTCSCADRTSAGETDKHVTAARYVKAKTATCSGCSERFRHRDLLEVQESLTYFEGDLLCSECWHGSDAVVL